MLSKIAGLAALALGTVAEAAVVEHYWDATWVWAAPDGTARSVIGINGQFPNPTIRAAVGDTVKVHLTNRLGNQTTGIHWHGINQISTSWMDGPSMVTQCPIPPNSTFTYEFVADAAGTYWWHSHNLGQYPDGLRGPLIIEDTYDPYEGQYDEEYILTASDWYHTDSFTLSQAMLSTSNPQGLPPFPDSALLNDGQSTDYTFEADKTYRFRIICFSAFASFMFQFNSHKMKVIMNDGAYVTPQEVDQLRITPAQRYDVLITGLSGDASNFPFLFSLDENRDFTSDPSTLVWPLNATGYLVMDPAGDRPTEVVDAWTPADDSKFIGTADDPALDAADVTIQLDFTPCTDSFGIPRMCFNGSPYIDQKVPTLYSAATVGEANEDTDVYGDVHPFIVHDGDIVDIVLNNLDAAVHPFHLHGHHYQVIDRPASGSGKWPGADAVTAPANPPRRDTLAVMANSYGVMRFKANNPGVYLFHCHIEWHVEMGLTATFIEGPDRMRGMTFPVDHINNCKKQNIPYAGNAGGNTQDYSDHSNYLTVPPEQYVGALFQQ